MLGVRHHADGDREDRLALLVEALLHHLAGLGRVLGGLAAAHRPVLELPDLEAGLGGRRRRGRGAAEMAALRRRGCRGLRAEALRRLACPAGPEAPPGGSGEKKRQGDERRQAIGPRRRRWARSDAKLPSLQTARRARYSAKREPRQQAPSTRRRPLPTRRQLNVRWGALAPSPWPCAAPARGCSAPCMR